MNEQVVILYAIPNRVGYGASPYPMAYDVTELDHPAQAKVQQELEREGYFVQVWFPQDPITVLATAEVRQRMQQEAPRG